MQLYFYLLTLLLTGNTMQPFASHRQLFIFGKDQHLQSVQQQSHLLDKASEGVKERDLKVIIVEKDNSLYQQYKINRGQFAVILIGKDGGEKYRTDKVLQVVELFAIIDGMPMRKAEMNKKN